jgi:hypothetical protein
MGYLLPPMAVFASKCRYERSSTTLRRILSLGAIEHSFFWTFMTIGSNILHMRTLIEGQEGGAREEAR